jgi:hypothetical protein
MVPWGKDGKTFRRTVKIVLNRRQWEAWKKIGTPEIKKILEHIHDQRLEETAEIIRTWKANEQSKQR